MSFLRYGKDRKHDIVLIQKFPGRFVNDISHCRRNLIQNRQAIVIGINNTVPSSSGTKKDNLFKMSA